MAYYLDLFSPATYEAFSRSDRTISGVRPRQRAAAQRIKAGDRFLCYMTKLSREAFRQGLRELGWVEGRNISIEFRDAGGRPERLSDLVAELVRLKVDVIVARGSQPVTAGSRGAARGTSRPARVC